MKVPLFILLGIVVGVTLLAPPKLSAGDRKIKSDQDGGLWCSKEVCNDAPNCCGNAAALL